MPCARATCARCRCKLIKWVVRHGGSDVCAVRPCHNELLRCSAPGSSGTQLQHLRRGLHGLGGCRLHACNTWRTESSLFHPVSVLNESCVGGDRMHVGLPKDWIRLARHQEESYLSPCIPFKDRSRTSIGLR